MSKFGAGRGSDTKGVGARNTHPTKSDREAQLAFKHTVLRLDRGCVAHMLHGKCAGPLQAHHAITQQVLRRWKLDHLLWDPNVGVTVCERAHARHHSRLEPLPLAVLPKRVLGFAREHGFTEWLGRVYV